MLRSSSQFRVMEGLFRKGPNRIQQVATLPVLAQDIDHIDFHTKWHPGLYSPVAQDTPFVTCKILFYRRIITAAPVSLNNKCLLTPFLVDTGAPSTYLHTYALKKFYAQEVADFRKIPGNEKKDPPFSSEFVMNIGPKEICAGHNTNTDERLVLSHLNILGMDFLEIALPGLLPWISENFTKFQPPISSVVVNFNDVRRFVVFPKQPRVLELRVAIKEELHPKLKDVDATRLIIKNSTTGEELGDLAPLHANFEYSAFVGPDWSF
jgi:hypothetical protein